MLLALRQESLTEILSANKKFENKQLSSLLSLFPMLVAQSA